LDASVIAPASGPARKSTSPKCEKEINRVKGNRLQNDQVEIDVAEGDYQWITSEVLPHPLAVLNIDVDPNTQRHSEIQGNTP